MLCVCVWVGGGGGGGGKWCFSLEYLILKNYYLDFPILILTEPRNKTKQ